jgi:hypothetical protein
METCMPNYLDWCNFLVTALLSMLLIIFTVRISKRQNQLQKQISGDQNQLQKLLADKDEKVAMYQHRMNCYMQVMQALDIIIYAKLENMLQVYNSKNITNILDKISGGRALLFKSCVESETLFNQDIVAYIGNIYSKYDKIYGIFCDIVMLPNEEFCKRGIQLMTAIGYLDGDSESDILLKYYSFLKSEGSKDKIITIYPEFNEYSKLLDELCNIYQPKNELINMIDKYLNMKDWQVKLNENNIK